jgi:DNA modification methylase
MTDVITLRQAPYVDAEAVVERLASHDWAFDGADTLGDGHGVHPYPAKFPPQVPRQVIEELSEPGDLVVDPFGGSGTTALEAVRLGRRALTIDANSVGVRLTRVKVRGVDEGDIALLQDLVATVRLELHGLCGSTDERCSVLDAAPTIPNRSKWFARESVHELSHVRLLVGELDGAARDVAELALGQAAARVSFQESETRYVSRPREVKRGEAFERFLAELGRMLETVPRRQGPSAAPCEAVDGDARDGRNWRVPAGSAALVVTSPPYPNAYDYHLYHRFRLLWTGAEPTELRRVEIGSHLRQQTVADPIQDYEADMSAVFANAWTALRPGGWLVLVVGDGKYRGMIYSTSDAMARIGADMGFEVGGVVTRDLPTTRRSVTVAGRRLEQEQLVFLRKPGAVIASGPAWQMVDYEDDLSTRELAILTARDPHDLRDLTFARSVSVGGKIQPTVQGMLEAADGTRRKNSTYASHGIHRYKGKFYPQLGRCLINLSCGFGSLVVDPFAGSGTVGLESILLGRRFHGIELSPVGAATATAKVSLMTAPADALQDASTIFGRLGTSSEGVGVMWDAFDPATHEELASWFALSVLARIGRVLKLIGDAEERHPYGDVIGEAARVCLSDLIRDVSHQDPSDLRIRRRKEPLTEAPVETMFLERWNEVVRRVLAARNVVGALRGDAHIIQGDSTDPRNWPVAADGSPAPISAVVSSPPYAAALPYLDTDRLSLAAVFGNSKRVRAGLEAKLVGSREITTRDLRSWAEWLRSEDVAETLPASTSAFLLALSDAVAADNDAGFRKQQTSAVLTRYFVAMSKVLREISFRLRPGGQAWYVLGDSRTTVGGEKWTIPTTQETAAIAKHHGLELVESIPITVTRENMRHAKNAITKNTLLHFQSR